MSAFISPAVLVRNFKVPGFQSTFFKAFGTKLRAAKNPAAVKLLIQPKNFSRNFFVVCEEARDMVEADRPRAAEKIVTAKRYVEGGGFVVRRALGSPMLRTFDPFLMLDHLGPIDYAPGEAVGAPDHPHRGQETVTYVLSGSFQHKDSAGHHGDLLPGDVQWMTAGSGVVHSEMPSEDLFKNGGRLEGFQLWVNLPRKDKMTPPRYQDIRAASIPEATSPDGKVSVRVIAGSSLGKEAVIETKTPIMYLDVRLQPGAEFVQPIPDDFEGFAYVFGGEASLGSPTPQHAKESDLVVLGPGSSFRIATSSSPAKVLLLAGRPIKEPLVWHGPFVMNTEEEIQQAVRDYRSGKLGRIAGEEERYAQTREARARQGGSAP